MSKCKHHWHVFTRHEHNGGAEITRKCCHCGAVEVETVPPPRNEPFTHDGSKCGPMAEHPKRHGGGDG